MVRHKIYVIIYDASNQQSEIKQLKESNTIIMNLIHTYLTDIYYIWMYKAILY